MTRTADSISLSGILSFLNDQGVRYRLCRFSSFSTDTEIEHEIARLGLGLLQAVPLDIEEEKPILAILPSALAVSLSAFSKLLESRPIRFLAPSEIKERLSLDCPSSLIPPLGGLLGMRTYLSPLAEQQHMVGFLVESKNTLVKLPRSEFRRTCLDVSVIPLPAVPKYRAYASPGRKANSRCILGISLENSDFHTSRLVTTTDWISRHYSDCIVMLGDGLHRITLQLESSASERDALELSKWLARDFVYSQLAVFALSESKCQFTFVFCSDIQTTDHYRIYYDRLLTLFKENKQFHASVTTFSSEFLKRRGQQNSDEKRMEMSSRYLLEELAVISCLTDCGPSTFVYPGSLTILREIAEGKHPLIPACLQQIDYVELKLKHRDK